MRHQQEIAETLCENRHDPDSDCEGFCYLKKKFTHDHSHEMPDNAPAISSSQPFLGLFWESAKNRTHYLLIAHTSFPVHKDPPIDGIFGKVFRPPQSIG